MERKPFIAGNWKMNLTVPESVEFATELTRRLTGLTGREILVAPPYTSLAAVSRVLTGSPIALGAQNMYSEESGAYTGEISPVMLLSTGCTHVIVGHSERRHILGECDKLIGRKVALAVKKGLIPILCVGETLTEREDGRTRLVVETQVHLGLKDLTKADTSRIIIAYEPVWAIGTGRTATPDQAEEIHRFIRELFSGLYGDTAGERLRILYGGSVKPDNISQLMAQPDVDGALVGGASLKADDFEKIAKYNCEASKS